MVMENKITTTKKTFLAAMSLVALLAIVHAPEIPVNSTTLPLSPDTDNDRTAAYRGFVNDGFGNVVYSGGDLCNETYPNKCTGPTFSHDVVCYHNPDRVYTQGRSHDSACPQERIGLKPDCDDTDNAYYPQALPMQRDIKGIKIATTESFNQQQRQECGITPAGKLNIYDNLQVTLTLDKKYKCFVNEATYNAGDFYPGATNKTFTATAYIAANRREFEIGNILFTAKEDEKLGNPAMDNEYTSEIIGSPAIGVPTGFIADKVAQRELLSLIDQKVVTKIRIKWNHAFAGPQMFEAPIGMANGIEQITNLRAQIEPKYALQTYNQTKVLPALPVNLGDSLQVKATAEGSIRCDTLPAVQLETGANPVDITPPLFQAQPGTVSKPSYKVTQASGSGQVELNILPEAPISALEPLSGTSPAQYGAAMDKIKNEAKILVSIAAKSPDYSKSSSDPNAETPVVKEKETAQVPASTCKQVAGNGTKKIVFLAGKSAGMGTAELEAFIKEFKNNYMETIDPMKTYKNDFSYYIDEKIQEDDEAHWKVTAGGANFDRETLDKVKAGASCKDALLTVIFSGRTYTAYAWGGKKGGTLLINVIGKKYFYEAAGFEATEDAFKANVSESIVHELGHAIGGLADEYMVYGSIGLSYSVYDGRVPAEPNDKAAKNYYLLYPNCTWNPEQTYKKNGKLYGDTNQTTCTASQVEFVKSKNSKKPLTLKLFRPSYEGFMNASQKVGDRLAYRVPKFSAFDCAYLAAAIKGGKVDDYFSACLQMDTIKPQAASNANPATTK